MSTDRDNADTFLNYDYNYYGDSEPASFTPVEGNYSVTDFTNDTAVINAFETVTDHLAENRGIGSTLLDTATIGEQTDIAEFMRDDEFRIGTKLVKANILEDAPESVKAAYRLMRDRWEKSSLTGAGETLEAVKDYGIDAIFNPETIGTVAGAFFSKGKSLPADIAKRKAGKEALEKSIAASTSAVAKNPLAYSSAIGATYAGVDNLAMQQLEISMDNRTERDFAQTAEVAGIGAIAGAGIYGATRLGAKYFSKGTDIADDVSPTPEMFDEALEGDFIPSSGGTIVADTGRLLEGSGDNVEFKDINVDDIDIDAFVKDIGGGEKTKQEIRDGIRAAIASETTAAGVQNKTKQTIYKTYANLSGNWFGKAAGVLSPYTNLSATAKILQAKLSHEFGTGIFDYSSKKVEKDLSEVQRQVTGGFSDKFRAIVEDISLHSAKGTLATDINDLLMLALRGNEAVVSKNLDKKTTEAINTAAGNIRELYREMGTSLKDIGVIDKLVENYIPRMWDRKAIEANPEKLAKLLEEKGGYDVGTGMKTVEDMLAIRDQIDSGSSGGHFFSAKRKLNELENDAEFQEFLNDDVLGSLNMYTFQAGKSIAKHRVLGVNNLAQFQKLWTNRIKNELYSKGERLSEKDIKQIDLLYKTATGEGMERYGKGVQTAIDTYGFVNRVGLLGFAALSSLTEVFINISKAGVVNSVKGFGEALEVSYKGITGDLTDQLQTNHGLTAKEAFSEMRKYGIAMDQAMAQQGNRLAGDDLMNETLQNASNKFFRVTLLDQWTKFVQTTSYASGKNLITENIQALAANGGNLSTKRLKTLAGELRELDIDPDEAVQWFNKGSKKTDSFYNNSILGGAARYSNSVILQPTAMSGLKPLLHSNPKTAIAFQLLGYPVAFTNTILKGAAKAIIKDPSRNVAKTLGAGLIMTEMARWTNYARSNGESEKDKTWLEIRSEALKRIGANGIILDSIQRARESSMYTKNASPYLMLPFGPIGSDAQKFYQQGILPTLGGKVPFISGSYMGLPRAITGIDDLGEYPIHDYKEALKDMQKKYIRDPLVQEGEPDKGKFGYKKGGEVAVPNAPSEPDERIDKITGRPYNQQAGSAFMDEEDPLKVLMNNGGKVKRKKYMTGAVVKGATKLASALAESLSNKVDNYFEPEVINAAASNIEKQIKDTGIDPETPFLDDYVDALVDNSLEADIRRPISELKEIPEWTKAIENQDESKQAQLWAEYQEVSGMSERKIAALDTIARLESDIDPVRALSSVVPNSLGNLSTEYRRIRPEGEAKTWEETPNNKTTTKLVQQFKKYISNNTEGLSEEGIERLAIENVKRILSSDDPSINDLDLSNFLVYSASDPMPLMLEDLIANNEDLQKILRNSNLVNEAIEYSDYSYGTLTKELQRYLKRAFFQQRAAKALEDAGYNPERLNRWGIGAEMEKDGVTFSERNPIGFYSLAEKAAKELNRKEGTGNEWVKELTAKGVKEDELNWTGFIEKFGDKKDEDGNIIKVKYNKNEVTKFLRDNRLDVEESEIEDSYASFTLRGTEKTKNYRTVLLTLPKNKESAAGTYINQAHYPDTENPIVHLRFSDNNRMRNKDLILEEYQSDVHMQGEKSKYTDDPLKIKDPVDDWDSPANDEINNIDQQIEMLQDQILTLGDYDMDDPAINDLEIEIGFLFAQRNQLTDAGPVPQMPFKAKRSGAGWQELGVKRTLIEAAKGDYDNLIIPTAKEQIRRYGDSFNTDALVKNYDKVLVKLLNNFAKKYEQEVINLETYPVSTDLDIVSYRGQGYIKMLPITPEMKRDILRGLPQFYAGGLMKRKAYSVAGAVAKAGTKLFSKVKDTATKDIAMPEGLKYDPETVDMSDKSDATLKPYAEVEPFATKEEMYKALEEHKKQKIDIPIEEGSEVGIRLDIPAYQKGKDSAWVPTIHDEKNTGLTSHRATVALRNVDLRPSKGNEEQAYRIKMKAHHIKQINKLVSEGKLRDKYRTGDLEAGKLIDATSKEGRKMIAKIKKAYDKTNYSRIKGNLVNRTDEENYRLAQEALTSDEWTQVGYNPDRHSYYFDRKTGEPVLSGDEGIQVGPLVLIKNAVFGNRKDFKYSSGGKVLNTLKRARN